MKNEIVPLLKAESKEREMRQLHIKIKRSENLIKHDDEIFGRKKRSWIMSANDKIAVKKEAQRKDLGRFETRKLMSKDEQEKLERKMKEKQQRKRDLEWSKKLGGKAISNKKKEQKRLRIANRTKTGGDAVDMIKNPYKYNTNIKKNIEIKMKKNKKHKNNTQKLRSYANEFGGDDRSKIRFKSGGSKKGKWNNRQLKKKMRAKGNKTRFKNRRK